jgi:secreted trypsin-like serine protease
VAVFASGPQGTSLCTGTLIAPNWVATAAHCVYDGGGLADAENVQVLYGTPLLSSTSASHLLSAHAVYPHPAYDQATNLWDAALIELKRAAPRTPMPIADPARENDYVADGGVNLAGYGQLIAGSKSNSSGTLRTGTISMVDPTVCSTASSDCYLPGPARQITCFGDSGGPVTRRDVATGRPVLYGITSTGPLPCDAALGQYPTAVSTATRVSAVAPWIRETQASSDYTPLSARTPEEETAADVAGARGIDPDQVVPYVGFKELSSSIKRAPTRERGGLARLTFRLDGQARVRFKAERCIKQRCVALPKQEVTVNNPAAVYHLRLRTPRCMAHARIRMRAAVTDLEDNAGERIRTGVYSCPPKR